MEKRECSLHSMMGTNPDEQGNADLVLTLKDGRDIALCVCPNCLGDLIAQLVLMRSDLLNRRSTFRRDQERRSRLN